MILQVLYAERERVCQETGDKWLIQICGNGHPPHDTIRFYLVDSLTLRGNNNYAEINNFSAVSYLLVVVKSESNRESRVVVVFFS